LLGRHHQLTTFVTASMGIFGGPHMHTWVPVCDAERRSCPKIEYRPIEDIKGQETRCSCNKSWYKKLTTTPDFSLYLYGNGRASVALAY
jgi:hypothetical protein